MFFTVMVGSGALTRINWDAYGSCPWSALVTLLDKRMRFTRSVSLDHSRGPTRAWRSVEATMSVKKTGHGSHVALGPTADTAQKLFNLVHQGIGVDQEEQVVVAGEHHELGMGDVLGQVPTRPQVDQTVALAVQNQGGDRDGREKRTNITFPLGQDEAGDLIGATEESHRAGEPGSESAGRRSG
jgi:hypothetical protein